MPGPGLGVVPEPQLQGALLRPEEQGSPILRTEGLCRDAQGGGWGEGWAGLAVGVGVSVLTERQLSRLALPPLEGKSEIESEPWQGQPSGGRATLRLPQSRVSQEFPVSPTPPPPTVIQPTFSLVSFRL